LHVNPVHVATREGCSQPARLIWRAQAVAKLASAQALHAQLCSGGGAQGAAAAEQLQEVPSSERSDGSHASGDRPSASGGSGSEPGEDEPNEAPAATGGMRTCDYPSLTDLASAAEQGARLDR
jgi:hypothetical protein